MIGVFWGARGTADLTSSYTKHIMGLLTQKTGGSIFVKKQVGKRKLGASDMKGFVDIL